MTIQFSLLN